MRLIVICNNCKREMNVKPIYDKKCGCCGGNIEGIIRCTICKHEQYYKPEYIVRAEDDCIPLIFFIITAGLLIGVFFGMVGTITGAIIGGLIGYYYNKREKKMVKEFSPFK